MEIYWKVPIAHTALSHLVGHMATAIGVQAFFQMPEDPRRHSGHTQHPSVTLLSTKKRVLGSEKRNKHRSTKAPENDIQLCYRFKSAGPNFSPSRMPFWS